MADKAYITPNVLKWARESARMTEETASSKVSVSTEKLREWEEGLSQPTIRQAQNLAKAYKRPFALFFLSEVPRDFQPLQDFRKKGSKELTKEEIERQDFVDNKIFELINQINPSGKKLEWDIEMIGEVRDVISSWVVDKHEFCGEREFYG